ncbi:MULTISPECIES: DUF2214 domain-containing protein [unclassified Ensifer]|uniref:DUF2214 domain-containing protein n=1 Tax=unclassified Ensifer TaxID=2633371 RepID=UPI0008132D81|nr:MULTISPECIES: DUF2214 domain-containing protein [unclassified Ensifer]OCP24571.1 DUF2214 domain-containing protein [Ensifer sp. LC54]OCP26027.1 DUF2214 domain-containing protein [Ensifer sp. LC384]
MSAAELLEWLAAWPVASAMRRSATFYLVVNATHILAIGLLVGAIVPLDLRLLGFFGNMSLEVLGPFLSRAAAVGLALAIVTGFCLFSVRPSAYVTNAAFLAKIGLLGIGAANAASVHMGGAWRAVARGGPVANSVRLSAGVSLIVWPSAVLAGRWIGFL